MEKRSNTEQLAQWTTQALRLDKHVYTADHHEEGVANINTSEGPLSLMVDNNLRFWFRMMVRERLDLLHSQGMGNSVDQIIQNNSPTHRHDRTI